MLRRRLQHNQCLSSYIEDTDAYGVVYNGNYLRAYDRSLHTTSLLEECGLSPDENCQIHILMTDRLLL